MAAQALPRDAHTDRNGTLGSTMSKVVSTMSPPLLISTNDQSTSGIKT
jgi:hypothetical protein